MKNKAIFLILILLTGVLANSPGFVFSQTESEDTNESQDDQEEKVTICHIPPGNPDNAHTITIGKSAVEAHLTHGDTIGACETDVGVNSLSEDENNADNNHQENFGMYVSDFVQKRNEEFKQQREETKNAIKDCRENVRNAETKEERDAAKAFCKETLKEIKDNYKALRDEYRQLFKDYREEMKILIKETKGLKVSAQQKEDAMKKIEDIKAENENMTGKDKSVKAENQTMKEEKQTLKEEMQTMKEEKQSNKKENKTDVDNEED